MAMCSKKKFITKNFVYKNYIRLYLDDKYFLFRLEDQDYYRDIFTVLFNITPDEFSCQRLCLRTSKIDNLITMTLWKINLEKIEEKIIEIILEDSDFVVSSDLELFINESSEESEDEKMAESEFKGEGSSTITEKENKKLHKLFQGGGACSLYAFTKFIEAGFKIDDIEYEEHFFITNPNTNVYEALAKIYFDGVYSTFGIYYNCLLVNKSMVYSDYDTSSPVMFDVSQRCEAMELNMSVEPVEIPWIDSSALLARRLATVLKREDVSGGIRFYNNQKELMNENVPFDFEKLLNKEREDWISIYYYIFDFKISCERFLMEAADSFELIIPENCTVLDLKRRLQTKLITECERFVICRDGKRLRDNTMVNDKDKIHFFVATVLETVTPKELIGEGGYGQIFKCTVPNPTGTIALKKFTSLLHDDNEWKSFVSESLAMTTMPPHQNILKYLDLYLDGDDVCIGMEYISGGSLRQYLNKNGPLMEDEIKKFSTDIVHGVKHLHDHKINHRDIKGDNILLGVNNTVKLCDFGLASILTAFTYRELSQGICQTNARGSFRWMAPEIILGEVYGLKADIWSIGATVVEMITGKVPYHEHVMDTKVALIIGSTKRIDFVRPESMSRELTEFVYYCLIPTVSERPNIEGLLTLPFIKT